MDTFKILCWNRGTDNVAKKLEAWNSYLDTINSVSEPDIVFLQEEVNTCSSLFFNKKGYERFYVCEHQARCNAVVVKKSLLTTNNDIY